MELHVDRDKCVGHGKCYLIAPELFEPEEEDDWGRANVLKPTIDEGDFATVGKAEEALSLCPEFAISVTAAVSAE